MTTPRTVGRQRFGPDRIALVPVLVLLLGSLPLAASSGWLNGVVLVPLACAVWVLRARVVLAPVGVEVCNGLAAHRLPWDAVEGLAVPRRGPARLLRSDGGPLLLTAVPRRQLPVLRRAAQELGGGARPETAQTSAPDLGSDGRPGSVPTSAPDPGRGDRE